MSIVTSSNVITDATRKAALSWGTSQQGGQTDGGSLLYQNLCTNGGFETNATGWDTNDGSLAVSRDTSGAKFGSAQGKVTSSANGEIASVRFGNASTVSAIAGTAYTNSIWVKDGNTSGKSVYIEIDFYDSGGILLGHVSGTETALTGSYQLLTATMTAPASTDHVQLRVVTSNHGAGFANGDCFFVDGAQIETGSVAHDFVNTDGSTAFGFTPDSSYFIGRAATNLFRRGQCDATTDWNNSSSHATYTTDATTPSPFSTQSIKVACDGTSQAGGNAISGTGLALAATTNVSGSIYVLGQAGVSYKSYITIFNTDSSSTFGTATAFTATGSWQLITPTSVAVAAGKTGDSVAIAMQINQATAGNFWVAHAMLESGQTVVAPYVATSGGVTATKAAARVQAPASLLNATQGWVAMRVKMGWPTSGGGGNAFVMQWSSGVDRINVYIPTNSWRIEKIAGGVYYDLFSATDSWSVGDYRTVVGYWTATTIGISANGSAFVTLAASGTPSALLPSFFIGSNDAAGNAVLDSSVFWFACGTGTLSNADAATINGFGNNDVGIGAFPGSPTMFWSAKDDHYMQVSDGTVQPTILHPIGMGVTL